jgi:hypothetical protein
MALHLTQKMVALRITLTLQTDTLLQDIGSCWQLVHTVRSVTMYKTLRLIDLSRLDQCGR